MLKQLEVKNFESHEHTTVDFTDGFNLICGASNSGKSALIRSLKLICYGDWNPESLRKGAKTCTVTLTTDKGRAQVTRGSNTNEWEVEPLGQPIKKFSKPGKGILDEVAEIVGLKVIKMGTQEVRPNIMDQLEGHFLMDELEGEKTSGSTRAQVIDEISGLAGMEDIIREVNLDNVRNTREINTSEEQAKEIVKAKHDQITLDIEHATTTASQTLLDSHDVAQDQLTKINALQASKCEIEASISESVKVLSSIPNIAKAKTCIESGAAKNADSNTASKLAELAKTAQNEQNLAKIAIQKIPDTNKAKTALSTAETKIAEAQEAEKLAKSYQTVQNEHNLSITAIQKIPDTTKALETLDKAQKSKESANIALKLANSVKETQIEISDIESAILSTDTLLKKATTELNEAMDEIEICPICLGPKHDGCGDCK